MIFGVFDCNTTAQIQACEMVTPRFSQNMPKCQTNIDRIWLFHPNFLEISKIQHKDSQQNPSSRKWFWGSWTTGVPLPTWPFLENIWGLRHVWSYVRMIFGVFNCNTTAQIQACEMVTPRFSQNMPKCQTNIDRIWLFHPNFLEISKIHKDSQQNPSSRKWFWGSWTTGVPLPTWSFLENIWGLKHVYPRRCDIDFRWFYFEGP